MTTWLPFLGSIAMQAESTFKPFYGANLLAAAAFAAGCMSMPGHADATSLRRVPGEPVWLPYGSNFDWAQTSTSPGFYLGAGQGEATRETSLQEHLIAQLRAWEGRAANWDGDGAARPDLVSLRAASNFICALDRDARMPHPMLNDNGRAGLFWEDEHLYADLEFLENGSIAYYIERVGEQGAPADRHKGVVAFDGQTIPAAIVPLLQA